MGGIRSFTTQTKMVRMVEITIIQEQKPDILRRDSRGTLIELGKRIAYNRSGTVVLGKIMWFRSDWKTMPNHKDRNWWRIQFSMRVEGDDETVTTLKNPNSFVII